MYEFLLETFQFVYSMFNRCVQTNTGKLKAQLTRDKLVTELTTKKLDSS